MRPIDGDALKQECMYIDGIPAVTERDIDDAPTIPAIPVEWMRNVLEEAKEFPRSERETIVAIPYLIKRWQKEQETQDG